MAIIHPPTQQRAGTVFSIPGFTREVIGKAAEAAPAAAMASTGALAGLALQGPLLASGAGLGIGLFTHGAKTYADLRNKDLHIAI